MCLTYRTRIVHFFGMLEKKIIYKKNLFLLSQKNFPGLPYWVPKIDVPKIGISLSKQT